MQNQPGEHKLFVGGIGRDVEEEEFVEKFSEFGDLNDWTFYERRGFGFVSYHRKQDAQRAIRRMNGKCMGYLPMQVNWADGHRPRASQETAVRRSSYTSSVASSDSGSPRPEFGVDYDSIFNETTPNNSTVYCGGLVPTTTDELIKKIFSPFGIIESIKLYVDRRADYGFIRFTTKEAACLAICSIDGTLIKGSRVKCSWSRKTDGHSTELESEGLPASTPPRDIIRPLIGDEDVSEGLPASTLPRDISQPLIGEEEQQSSETYPGHSFTSIISDIQDMQNSFSSQLRFYTGAAAASVPLTEDEPQGAACSREVKTDLMCKICMDEELGIVFLPCGHLTSCEKCAQKMSSCPVCRKRITNKLRTYLS